jgi:hypothetical protein
MSDNKKKKPTSFLFIFAVGMLGVVFYYILAALGIMPWTS